MDPLTLPSPAPAPLCSPRVALGNYGRVALEARVSGASPHALVLMLYERLAKLLRTARAAADAGDGARRLQATERAIAIIEGLDATLDDARGGEVAARLHEVYALLGARILLATPTALGEAQESVDMLVDAWRTIAPVTRAG
jgi:flagellar protein FliS